MKLSFSLLIIPMFILAAALATPSSACEYEINRACNLTLENMECKRISVSEKGVVYLNIRIQNKSDCRFDNVKVLYTIRTKRDEIIFTGELDAGTLDPYENKVKVYRIKELRVSTDLKGVICDLSLKI
jgi:hypothetical protein